MRRYSSRVVIRFGTMTVVLGDEERLAPEFGREVGAGSRDDCVPPCRRREIEDVGRARPEYGGDRLAPGSGRHVDVLGLRERAPRERVDAGHVHAGVTEVLRDRQHRVEEP